ncbi:hypothetical protein LMH87_010475 [Akanthomyces muscarius]|uniref:Uncharacterized protein n=1 Tax=Akanthomyces muscarius TaxID=2231603 RepID=A0A9W8QG47_AKAMU|nr:hypothetical protein LMH87_010475 [Akanthomyces muscarius]KAJ4154011.1 hypothetical protein LMH87_010475 [Akanthomyces muscarius]
MSLNTTSVAEWLGSQHRMTLLVTSRQLLALEICRVPPSQQALIALSDSAPPVPASARTVIISNPLSVSRTAPAQSIQGKWTDSGYDLLVESRD